ncbi:F-type H+-transporting ATPase subunit delta [Kroppenstedtia sanguinis]|uniref:ATP synthase subunit delta n=1 Tax=Kroppenstedtia sanguinis TaxID=1380684 RepID=A0ABW4CAT0_9BACL
MSLSIIGKRYGRALFEAAKEQKTLDQTAKDWQLVTDVWTQHPELREWAVHPQVSSGEKKEVYDKLFQDLSDLARNLLHLIAERNRENAIEAIGSEYQALVHEEKGVAEAEVITSHPLTKTGEKELIAVFQKIIGKKLVITNRVEPDILGGAVVRIGDRLYDGSLVNKLKRFRKELTAIHIG